MELHTGLIEINWTSLMILINIFILYIVLKKFFWEKVKAFMDDRSNSIRDAIDAADAMNKRADLKLAGYNKKIAGIEDEGREIIKKAKATADIQAQIVIEEARKEAQDIIAKANRTVEMEREKAVEEMKQEITTISLMVAEQIIGKEISVSGHEELVEEAIRKVREGQCQN